MFQPIRSSVNSLRSSIASPRVPYVCQRCLTRIQARRQQAFRLAGKSTQSHSLHETSRASSVVSTKETKDVRQHVTVEKPTKGGKKKSKSKDPRLERWELVVGIEVHAELNTARKLFSAAQTSSNAIPNTHVALFDVAFPGAQPQFQKETVIPALRAALALNCSIQNKSSFDRKHYYYQDQPAGYQITQYYEPFAEDGHVKLYSHDGIAPEDGDSVVIGIKQIQMEQDTAKTIHHPPSTHLLDFNRVSHPLIEIITLPQIHQPATAAACVRKIQSILKSVDAATAGMEVGGLRADVNVSVRRRDQAAGDRLNNSYSGVTGLGQRTEIKNLSSVKAIENAIIAERNRQIDVLESGGVIEGETRGWTIGQTVTTKLRGKEGEVDYRYMPDPDLSPVFIGNDLIDHLRETLPKVPDETLDMLVKNSKYGLTMKDAKTILVLDDGERLDYYMELVEILRAEFAGQDDVLSKTGKTAGNWVLHELGGLLVSSDTEWIDNPVPVSKIASILSHLLSRQVTGKVAKNLLSTVFDDPSIDIVQVIEEENLLLRPMLRDEYVALASEIIEANDETAQAVRDTGHQGKLMFLVGQMIRNGEEGRIEADKAKAILQEQLGVLV